MSAVMTAVDMWAAMQPLRGDEYSRWRRKVAEMSLEEWEINSSERPSETQIKDFKLK